MPGCLQTFLHRRIRWILVPAIGKAKAHPVRAVR
jgi:hypothetical protein